MGWVMEVVMAHPALALLGNLTPGASEARFQPPPVLNGGAWCVIQNT